MKIKKLTTKITIMKTKRPRNGIKTVMFHVRLDEDIHKWLKDSQINASEFINTNLRYYMEAWKTKQKEIQYENIPSYNKQL